MYDEDRTRVLELYNDIFDEADNETAVLQLLVAPTRQAVNLARAYDARNRSYQESGSTPGYLQVIDRLRAQVQALSPAAPRPDSDQLPPLDYVSTEKDPIADLGIRAENELPPAPLPEEINSFPDEDKDPQATVPAPPPAAVVVKAAEAPTPQEQNVDEFADAVEAFLADFKISDDALTAGSAAYNGTAADAGNASDRPDLPDREIDPDEWLRAPADSAPAEKAAEAPAATEQQAPAVQQPAAEIPPAQEQPDTQTVKPAVERARRMAVADLPNLPNIPETTVREPIVPLLILFVVLAIPLGLLCAGLIVTLACASLSVGAALLGAAIIGFGAAFTAFSVFADILLVFGLSLAAAAFSLLFFWIFVWLLIGVLPDMVGGICALARKLCYREVTV